MDSLWTKNADSQETGSKLASFFLPVRDRGVQKKKGPSGWDLIDCLINVVRAGKELNGDEVDEFESSRAIS